MRIKTFNYGIYADLIRQYVEYKRSLGFKMENTERCLRRFDTLTIDRKEIEIGISKDLFEAWISASPTEESRSNRCQRIKHLRGFSAFLQLKGYNSYMPKLPKCQSRFTPYIYTKQEMQSIFMECDKLFVSHKHVYSQACVMSTLIRILYATGMRISEAIKIKNRDIDLDAGYIVLRECKNGQDRVLPVSSSLKEVCKDYVLYKQSQGISTAKEDFFFIARARKPCFGGTIYRIFRTILFRSGISHGGRGKGPRLHDFRHTFCVNALVKMSESGQDLYYSMPILMTYVGHQSIKSTNQYVRLTVDMYPNLLKKVDGTYKYIFPEIGIEISDTSNNKNVEQ
jgi:integrase